MSADGKSDKIAQRAYELWEREGRPEGRHHDHWIDAEREIDNEGQSSGERAPGGGMGGVPGTQSQGLSDAKSGPGKNTPL